MITDLSVENIAVIEKAHLHLGPGFTVLTGETGAGKSLLVEAIGLVLGDRADSDLVRAGAARGRVRVSFDLSARRDLLDLMAAEGIASGDGQLSIEREVSSEGRSTTRVQGRNVSVASLRKLGVGLVDLHGQHDHQLLLDPLQHLPTYDQWLGEGLEPLLERVRALHADWIGAKQSLALVRRSVKDRQQRLDLLSFQLNELETAELSLGEVEELEQQLSRLRNVERLQAAARGAMELLQRGEVNAVEQLGEAVKQLDAVASLDALLAEHVAALQSSLFEVQDAVLELGRYEEGVEADPEQLAAIGERLDLIQRLMRKHDRAEPELIALLDELRREKAVLEDAESSEEALGARVQQTEAALLEGAGVLSAYRKEHAARFAEQVTEHLRELALERACFELHFDSKPVDELGIDAVTFRFTANAGEPPRLLSRTASGGELSRVMLALKVVLAGKVGVPTLIFDEIDTGLSGRAAAVVAKKLQELGEFHQVISISHLPQLAGRAAAHYRIAKSEHALRTFTEILHLEGEERVIEMARMLAGEEIGDSAMANARELLRN